MLKWFGEFWCKQIHARLMWPVNGRYVCSICLRELHWERRYRPLRAARNVDHFSTNVTRSKSSAVLNGFGKKCTSVVGTP